MRVSMPVFFRASSDGTGVAGKMVELASRAYRSCAGATGWAPEFAGVFLGVNWERAQKRKRSDGTGEVSHRAWKQMDFHASRSRSDQRHWR